MSGSVSDSYSPPICACGRFKSTHDWPSGTIPQESDVTGCDRYTEVDFAESDLGKEVERFLSGSESRTKAVCECGDFKEQHNDSGECQLCKWNPSNPLEPCKQFVFSHYE